LSDEGKPESGESQQPPPQSGVERVRAERQRQLEGEPGYKAGKAIGKHLRRSTLIVLPIEMALAPVLLALGGWWLDNHIETTPWFTIAGAVSGLILSVRAVLRTIKEVSR
jgi:F0F1-type ATP synthase assembly protein I